jgi:hypothetical protein
VSWIVFLCLSAYWASRCALWVRGQVRFLRLRQGLPAWPVRPAAPRHLSDGLERLFSRGFDERVRLVESSRAIATVLITDPDAPLGWIRDFRYRLAVARAWSAACAWLRSLDDLAEDDRVRLERLGYSFVPFRERHAWLRERVGPTVRARALEPFAVGGVQTTHAVLGEMIGELESLERVLVHAAADPYRS